MLDSGDNIPYYVLTKYFMQLYICSWHSQYLLCPFHPSVSIWLTILYFPVSLQNHLYEVFLTFCYSSLSLALLQIWHLFYRPSGTVKLFRKIPGCTHLFIFVFLVSGRMSAPYIIQGRMALRKQLLLVPNKHA